MIIYIMNCDNIKFIKKISSLSIIILGTILFLYFLLYFILYFTNDCKNSEKNEMNFNITNICKQGSSNYLERKISNEKEVYNIQEQNLTYEQAQKKCEAYGAKLATKNQMTEAYNKGAHWCNYGWIEGNEAYYPVQSCFDDKNCGKPGLNGGYFPEENLKFGANCYGIKPKGKYVREKPEFCPEEKEKTFCELDQNKDSCSQLDDDKILPFNNEKWSMY